MIHFWLNSWEPPILKCMKHEKHRVFKLKSLQVCTFWISPSGFLVGPIRKLALVFPQPEGILPQDFFFMTPLS